MAFYYRVEVPRMGDDGKLFATQVAALAHAHEYVAALGRGCVPWDGLGENARHAATCAHGLAPVQGMDANIVPVAAVLHAESEPQRPRYSGVVRVIRVELQAAT